MQRKFITREEFAAMVDEEEKRLGIGSKEFIQRHNEIMELIDEARGKGAAADGKADYECQGCYGGSGSV